ncbi:MAG: hypothetical protein LBJ67_04365 [Planctomycetaceae bacterium]|jgi:hypothetical protein|nr:hypothetical protein [Planctomycetaceae bacterium]
MKTIILTGAIFPSCPVRRNDPKERLLDVLCAVQCWISEESLDHIVYCDASGFHIPETIFRSDKFESLSFDASETAREHEKGRAELDALYYVLQNSHYRIDSFFKCTGRLYVKNFSELRQEMYDPRHDARLRHDKTRFWTDTRFFWMKSNCFFENVLPYRSEITCYGGLSIEEVFYRKMKETPEFHQPRFVGYHALTNTLYDEYFSDEIQEKAGEWISKWDVTQNCFYYERN